MPLRFPRLAALVVALLLGLLLGIAPAWAHIADDQPPGDPTTTTETTTTEPATDEAPSTEADSEQQPTPAERIVAASRTYLNAGSKRASAAGGRANREVARCEDAIDAAPEPVWKPLDNLVANYLASTTWVAVEPAYRRFVSDLAAAASGDAALEKAAAAAAELHTLQAPLLAKPIGLCSIVLKWQKASWSKRFTARYKREFSPSLVSRADQKRASKAKLAVTPAVARLQELGVTPADAALFESAFGFVLV